MDNTVNPMTPVTNTNLDNKQKSKKLSPLLILVLLLIVLPLVVLLSQKSQENRSKASTNELRNGNLISSAASIGVGQEIAVYIDTSVTNAGGESFAYLEGNLNYSTQYWEPVSNLLADSSNHQFLSTATSVKIGAKSSSSLMTGRVAKIWLRAKQVTPANGVTTIALDGATSKGIRFNGSSKILAGALSLTITSNPTPSLGSTPGVSVTPTPSMRPTSTPVPALGVNEARFSVAAGATTANPDVYSITIGLSTGQKASGAMMKFYYNPTQLSYVSFRNGNIFTSASPSINGSGGTNWIDISGNTNNAPNGPTSGVFATLTFRLANSSVQSGTLTFRPSEAPNLIYALYGYNSKFTQYSFTPSNGVLTLTRGVAGTPTPTSSIRPTATPTNIPGVPTNTPVPTSTVNPNPPTPTPTTVVASHPCMENNVPNTYTIACKPGYPTDPCPSGRHRDYTGACGSGFICCPSN